MQVYAFEDLVDGKNVAYFGRYTNPVPIEHYEVAYFETENCVGFHFAAGTNTEFYGGPQGPGVVLQMCSGRRFVCQGELEIAELKRTAESNL